MNLLKTLIAVAGVLVGALCLTGATDSDMKSASVSLDDTAKTVVEEIVETTQPVTETTTPCTESTIITSATTFATTETTTVTTTTTVQEVTVQNLKTEAVSVSCIKVSWDSDTNREYEVYIQTAAPYIENVQFIFEGNDTCYLTGLRENSEYNIKVIPILDEAENAVAMTAEILCRTKQVTVIQEYEREEGWTNCFTGEKASGLTRMPSSGAIAGTTCDAITGTGIRRNEYGDYCCAMGLYYGVVGDRFLVELENGTQFTVQICDSKGMGDDADGDGVADGRFHWYGGEGNGKSVIEFIFDDGNLPSNVAYTGSWGYENWNGLDLRANILSIKKIETS